MHSGPKNGLVVVWFCISEMQRFGKPPCLSNLIAVSNGDDVVEVHCLFSPYPPSIWSPKKPKQRVWERGRACVVLQKMAAICFTKLPNPSSTTAQQALNRQRHHHITQPNSLIVPPHSLNSFTSLPFSRKILTTRLSTHLPISATVLSSLPTAYFFHLIPLSPFSFSFL